ncbi:hypothetical protein AC781_08985 [Akkermansia glycaniphila]|nr:hypothetical protein AC781_08985 [Akkermansia glycaniphila]
MSVRVFLSGFRPGLDEGKKALVARRFDGWVRRAGEQGLEVAASHPWQHAVAVGRPSSGIGGEPANAFDGWEFNFL